MISGLPERSYIPEPNSGCWLFLYRLDHDGYGRITYRGKTHTAHCLSYALSGKTVPVGQTLDHRCQVRCCVNPDHLEPVTFAENIRRSAKHKMRVPGEGRGSHKLTAETASAIRALFADGMSKRAIARRFKISPSTVRDVVSGRSWAAPPLVADHCQPETK